MKKYSILLITFFLASIAIISCKKDDIAGPEIMITSPASSQMFMGGDSVLIAFTVSDDDLHEVELNVLNAANSSIEYFSDGVHVHGTTTNYSEKFAVPAVLAHTDVILNVYAVDHNGNASSKNVTFAFMP